MSGKVKDRTGEQHYRLTFIQPLERRDKQGAVIWELLCKCGKTTFASGKDVVSGNTTSCGCYLNEQRIKVGKNNRKFDPIISSARIVWTNYKECDFDFFYSMSQQSCYYCGRAPHRTYIYKRGGGAFTYNGLDRVDSNKGHTPDNVVPCCYRCNQAKNDMATNEFFSLIKMIYEKHLLPVNL